ncbi:hypothetical protein IWW38_003293, partial [Coemansia aciculifera]
FVSQLWGSSPKPSSSSSDAESASAADSHKSTDDAMSEMHTKAEPAQPSAALPSSTSDEWVPTFVRHAAMDLEHSHMHHPMSEFAPSPFVHSQKPDTVMPSVATQCKGKHVESQFPALSHSQGVGRTNLHREQLSSGSSQLGAQNRLSESKDPWSTRNLLKMLFSMDMPLVNASSHLRSGLSATGGQASGLQYP